MRFAIPLLWAAAFAGLAAYAILVARQITYVTLADGRRSERRLPLSFRLLLPLTPNLRRFTAAPGMRQTREKTQSRLVAAGFEGLLSAQEFLAIKILLPLTTGILWAIAVKSAAKATGWFDNSSWLIIILGIAWAYAYPLLWLRRSLAERHRHILRSLPFVLDLLTLSVEAGLDFMTALRRNVRRRTIDPLNEELIRVIHEVQLGSPRRHALRAMAKRVDLADLRSVVNALAQADELGVSIGSILRIQADQIRQRRFERAEKLANEAPVKLLGPLMLFIFPAVFLILLAPVIVQMISQLY